MWYDDVWLVECYYVLVGFVVVFVEVYFGVCYVVEDVEVEVGFFGD